MAEERVSGNWKGLPGSKTGEVSHQETQFPNNTFSNNEVPRIIREAFPHCMRARCVENLGTRIS